MKIPVGHCASDIDPASCAVACAVMWFFSFSIVNVVMCVSFAVVNTAVQDIHHSGLRDKQVIQ